MGAARKCIWGVGVLQGSVTPADPLQSVPPLPPPAGSDGGALRGEWGQGPIHIDPIPPYTWAALRAASNRPRRMADTAHTQLHIHLTF